MPVVELLSRPFSRVIKDYADAGIAYEHSVTEIPGDRRVVEVLLGANDSFQLELIQAAAVIFCVSRVEHAGTPSISEARKLRKSEAFAGAKQRKKTSSPDISHEAADDVIALSRFK